jgi:hypothetical protein
VPTISASSFLLIVVSWIEGGRADWCE